MVSSLTRPHLSDSGYFVETSSSVPDTFLRQNLRPSSAGTTLVSRRQSIPVERWTSGRVSEVTTLGRRTVERKGKWGRGGNFCRSPVVVTRRLPFGTQKSGLTKCGSSPVLCLLRDRHKPLAHSVKVGLPRDSPLLGSLLSLSLHPSLLPSLSFRLSFPPSDLPLFFKILPVTGGVHCDPYPPLGVVGSHSTQWARKLKVLWL